jgi:hypothetical protein
MAPVNLHRQAVPATLHRERKPRERGKASADIANNVGFFTQCSAEIVWGGGG